MIKKITYTIMIMIFYFVGCTSEELTSARLYIQQKNWEKAEEYLFKAMEVEPENPEVFYSLGKYIYAKKKDWKNIFLILKIINFTPFIFIIHFIIFKKMFYFF